MLSLYITVAICFIIAILGLSFHARWSPRQIVQGPALLTMLGIAGTFLGIAVGLLTFNPADIQHSIPGLINGMRTAVWASLFGIVMAVTIKLRYAFVHDESAQDANRSDAEMIASQLEALQKAIAGDDESTVIGQMKMGRTDMNDRLDAIKRSQDAFMDRLAEMSSKTLIEALHQVIKDFNLNLNEQFGENFKQLNAAVHKLVEWQQQYREQMDRLIAIERETCDQLQIHRTSRRRRSRPRKDCSLSLKASAAFLTLRILTNLTLNRTRMRWQISSKRFGMTSLRYVARLAISLRLFPAQLRSTKRRLANFRDRSPSDLTQPQIR